jgi:hypothetical protein
MSIQDLEARLAAMDDEFRRAPSESSLYEPPPDGTYQALVDSWDHFEGGEPRQAFLKCVFQVQNHPDYGGRYAETIFSLEDPERLTFLNQHRLGDPVSRSDVTSNADIAAFDVEKSRDARYGATLPDF